MLTPTVKFLLAVGVLAYVTFSLAVYAHAVNALRYCDRATASEVKQFFRFGD